MAFLYCGAKVRIFSNICNPIWVETFLCIRFCLFLSKEEVCERGAGIVGKVKASEFDSDAFFVEGFEDGADEVIAQALGGA